MSKVTTYNKLVRDDIPGIIAKEGKRVCFRALKDDEFKQALKDKLLEEVQEFINAKTKEQQTEELADISTVLKAIELKFGIDRSLLSRTIDEKINEKGLFLKGYYLEMVEEVEDDAR